MVSNVELGLLDNSHSEKTEKESKYAKVSLLVVDCDRLQLWLGYFFPTLSVPVVSSVQHWQGTDLSRNLPFSQEEKLKRRVEELEETQQKLLATVESFKKQNQELFNDNERLHQQNRRLQQLVDQNALQEDPPKGDSIQ